MTTTTDNERKTTWPNCEICGKPVTTADGYLCIPWTRIQEIQRRHREEARREPVAVDLAGIAVPEPDWRWGHSACLTESDYWIDAKRIDTVEKAFGWTLHLFEKNWFHDTDWGHAVRRLYPIGHI